jgi:hypothetical protein
VIICVCVCVCVFVSAYLERVCTQSLIIRWLLPLSAKFEFVIPNLAQDQLRWWTPAMMIWAIEGGFKNSWKLVEKGIHTWEHWFEIYPLDHALIAAYRINDLIRKWREHVTKSTPVRLYQVMREWQPEPTEYHIGMMFIVLCTMDAEADMVMDSNLRGKLGVLGKPVLQVIFTQAMQAMSSNKLFTARMAMEMCLHNMCNGTMDEALWRVCAPTHTHAAMHSILSRVPSVVHVGPHLNDVLSAPLQLMDPTGVTVRATTPNDIRNWWISTLASIGQFVGNFVHARLIPDNVVSVDVPTGVPLSLCANEEALSSVVAHNKVAFVQHALHTLITNVTLHVDQILHRVDDKGDMERMLDFCGTLQGDAVVSLELLQRLDALCSVVPPGRTQTPAFAQLGRLIDALTASTSAPRGPVILTPSQNRAGVSVVAPYPTQPFSDSDSDGEE